MARGPKGSESKLSTFRDGWRILKTIVTLYRIERPVLFYGAIGALLLVAALILAVPLVLTYLDTGLVPRFPTAILVTGMIDHRGALLLRRPDPRHGHPRPARDAAARLSRACRRPASRPQLEPFAVRARCRPPANHKDPDLPWTIRTSSRSSFPSSSSSPTGASAASTSIRGCCASGSSSSPARSRTIWPRSITAQLLFLESENPKKDIFMYINSPGGVVTAGLAIHDTMQYIRPKIGTVCIGQAASMGSFLLAAGEPGHARRADQQPDHGPPAVGRRPGHGRGHRDPGARDPAHAPRASTSSTPNIPARRSRRSRRRWTATSSSRPTRPRPSASSTRCSTSAPTPARRRHRRQRRHAFLSGRFPV